MSDADSGSDCRGEAGVGVDNDAILHIRALAYADVLRIASQDRMEQYTRPTVYPDASNEFRAGGHIGAVGDLWLVSCEGVLHASQPRTVGRAPRLLR